eukprot:COSAG02_NODE_3525_length_6615_cov_2.025629_2_plen_72_part_00
MRVLLQTGSKREKNCCLLLPELEAGAIERLAQAIRQLTELVTTFRQREQLEMTRVALRLLISMVPLGSSTN